MARNFSIFQKKEEKRNKDLLIAATVIAAMAYQAALSPPGGIASMDAAEAPVPSHNGLDDLEPGASLLAYFYPNLSNLFWIANTISLMASLSVIFLYVSGLSLKRKFQVWVIRVAMWITLTSMTVAYVFAVLATSPTSTELYKIENTIKALIIALIAWGGLLFLSCCVLVYRCIRNTYYGIYSCCTGRKNTSAAPVPAPGPALDIDMV